MQTDDDQSVAMSTDTSFYEPSAGSVVSEADKGSVKTSESEKERRSNRSSVHTIKRKIDGKMKKINLFNTEIRIGAHIINATTGYPFGDVGGMTYSVGSKLEDDLFKMRYLTREESVPCMTLFFDSPEQCERHLGITIEPEIKQKCYERKQQFNARRIRLQ